MALCLMVLLVCLSGTAVSSSSDSVVASTSYASQAIFIAFDMATTSENCEKQSSKKLTNMSRRPADSIKIGDAKPTLTCVDTASEVESMAYIPLKAPTTFVTAAYPSTHSGENVELDKRDDTSWALACYKAGMQIPDR